jgi:hypothetical protein
MICNIDQINKSTNFMLEKSRLRKRTFGNPWVRKAAGGLAAAATRYCCYTLFGVAMALDKPDRKNKFLMRMLSMRIPVFMLFR